MPRQLFTYSMDDARWSIVVDAKDEFEGRRRLATAAQGTHEGVVGATVPGWVPVWMIDSAVRLLNLFRVGPPK